ncbi:MAG TPA: AAA family ATPase [Candidatus Polarisedimenticolaceae bacterium]|nr:AAA family ATPase [Candidatus Polarisedimenticolaceae bacterium]
MERGPLQPPGGHVEPFDRDALELRLREISRAVAPDRTVDDLELRHLMRVVSECSLLLTDVYSDQRIARIMQPERSLLSGLVHRLLEEERAGGGEVLYRVRRLPDDVRLVGDKALFDLGLTGLRRVKGYDLAELGARAYRVAGQVLELLAEDRRLREFFKQNRLLMLPLEEEVVFLQQCSDKLPLYAEILKRIQDPRDPSDATERAGEILSRVGWMAQAEEALATPSPAEDPYLLAARSQTAPDQAASREHLLSAYERTLLFAALDVDRLRSALGAVVVDQDAAVDALCDEFDLFAAGTRDPRKPPAFFLVGPTGVGKNHLVESLCRLLSGLWGAEVPMLTIEGPSYTYPSDIHELRGATRGFIRSDEDGLLATFHERSSRAPLSVILVDEVEKAHPQLRTFFLSILDRGTVTDNRGRVLDFSNTMVFFTSNLGYSDAQQGASPIGYREEDARQKAQDADVRRQLRRSLSPEFANRLRLVHFTRLSRTSARRILGLEMERILARYREVHGIEVRLTEAAEAELLRRGFSPEHGARHLAAVLESVCNVEIARRIHRDDRGPARDREALLRWLRELRAGGRAFDPAELKARVLAEARARTGYSVIRVDHDGGGFSYTPERG